MRKNVDRFNGVTEKELYDKTLPDIIEFNLDIVFVNINPGLYSVYKQHHYSGPGNHFWRCIFESGLTNRVLKSNDDYKLLDFKIGLVNMIEKPNIKTCQDMSSDEIKEAQMNLIKKIRLYKPKIVAFNGKSIYEVYTGSSVDKEFNFGKQTIRFDSNQTETLQFVLPSSSARCSQLPKVIDKVPFYAALKKLKDHFNGLISSVNDDDVMFPDFKVALDSRTLNSSELGDIEEDAVDKGIDDELADLHNEEDLDTSKNPTPGTNVHRIKFVRLNNLPYSQIPSYILDDLKKQRKVKKGITITTTRDYFNIKKASKSTTSVLTNTGSCSDLDTQSTATSDSEYGTTISSSLDNENSLSKISSIIFNVYSNNKTPKTPEPSTSSLKQLILNNTKSISQIKPVCESQGKKINVLLNEARIPQSSPLIVHKQVVQVPSQINLNQQQKSVYVIQQPNQGQIRPVEYQPQSQHVANSNPNGVFIDLELVKKDKYRFDDFYSFDNLNTQMPQNNFYCLTEDYFNGLKNDLNRSLKFCFGNDDFEGSGSNNSNKRLFTSVNEASSYILSNKRQCVVDLGKL